VADMVDEPVVLKTAQDSVGLGLGQLSLVGDGGCSTAFPAMN
jgi:hypothetical protein